ncbi:hypothetical protein ACOMHN_018912 [Nucella lapillus]
MADETNPGEEASPTGHWQSHGSDALCKFVYWLSQGVITTSIILFAFIAVDRYIKVCKPSIKITTRFSRNSLVVISGLSLLSAIPNFWMYGNNAQGKCAVKLSQVITMAFMKNYYTVLFASFLVMLLVVILSYTLVISKVRHSQKVMKAHQQLGKAGKGGTGKKTSRGGHTEQDSGNHTSYQTQGCWTTNTSLSGPQGLNHSVTASQLRLPKKAWLESDQHVHEKAQTAKLVSFSAYDGSNKETAQHKRNVDAGRKQLLSVPKSNSRENDVHIDTESNTESSFMSVKQGENGHADTYLVSSSADDGGFQKNTDGDEGTDINSPTSKTLEEEDVCKDLTSINEENGQNVIITDQNMGVNIPQKSCAENTDADIERRNLPPGDHGADRPDRNKNPADQEEGEKQQAAPAEEPIPQPRRGFRIHFQRNRQVQPLRDNSSPPPPKSQTRSSTPTRTTPSDDGQTNFSPKLTSRNPVITRSTIQRNSRTFRLTLLLMLVTMVFIVSWIPPYVAMVWFFYVGYTPPLSSSDMALQQYGPTGYVLNHFANPIIYLALSSSFRENLASLWRRLRGLVP